jgi:general secretion pathway protein L
MSKRFIGIDIDGRVLRTAVIGQERGATALLSVGRSEYADAEELAAALRALGAGENPFGTRTAAALPAGEGFVRRLRFPFAEPKKLEAALPFELAVQLPVPVEACLTDFRHPSGDGDGCALTAAAVRRETIAAFLEPFTEAGLPLQVLDLAPFAFVDGLRAELGDGLLACLTEREITLARVESGRAGDYRLLPAAPLAEEAELHRALLSEAARLSGGAALPLQLIGPRATPELVEGLSREWGAVAVPRLLLDGAPVAAEFLPAVALARRAAAAGRERLFNFRRGPFASRSEWVTLKRGLTVAGVLLAAAVTAAATAGWLVYAGKARRAEALQQQMVRTFNETFPGTPLVTDVPTQMRSKIEELRRRGRSFGLGRPGSALAVLAEISRRLPPEVVVDVRDLACDAEAVRLEGSTASFDAVNRLARTLEESSLFGAVQVADAKTSVDGSRVDFRLNLTYDGENADRDLATER